VSSPSRNLLHRRLRNRHLLVIISGQSVAQPIVAGCKGLYAFAKKEGRALQAFPALTCVPGRRRPKTRPSSPNAVSRLPCLETNWEGRAVELS